MFNNKSNLSKHMKLHTLPIGSQYSENNSQEYKDHDVGYDEVKDHDDNDHADEDKVHGTDVDHGEDKDNFILSIDDEDKNKEKTNNDERQELDPIDPETIMIDEQGRKWREILHNVSIREADDYFKNLGMEIQ